MRQRRNVAMANVGAQMRVHRAPRKTFGRPPSTAFNFISPGRLRIGEPRALLVQPMPPTNLSDYLAAERTFLAWIRTGLALAGFGFVIARFGLFLRAMRLDERSVALILDIDLKLREQPAVADEVSIL